jgi:propanol-preferring alcohol dehydrogenase
MGRVVVAGSDVTQVAEGARVGVDWLRRTCDECRWCRLGQENL